MGYKLVFMAQDHFRPLVQFPTRVKRDTTLERVFEHFARHAYESPAEDSPTKGRNCSISVKAVADRTGHSRTTVAEKLEDLIEMGAMSVTGYTDSGARIMSIDISAGAKYEKVPFTPSTRRNQEIGQGGDQPPTPQEDGDDPDQLLVTPAGGLDTLPCTATGHPLHSSWSQEGISSSVHHDHGENPENTSSITGPSSSSSSAAGSAGVESETEAQSARDNDPHHGDSEGRDGVGDELIPESPSPELKAAWYGPAQPIDFSKLTVASLDASQIEYEEMDLRRLVSTGITAEEAERQQMRFLADQQRASQPPSIPGGQSPTETPRGPERAAQRLQNPDPKAKRFGWEPSQAAYDHAKAICPDVNLDIIITEYWMWCHEKKIVPSATHWMKWVTKAQKELEIERAEKRRAEALEQREQKPWYEKDLKF